jgi:hypothetical protein
MKLRPTSKDMLDLASNVAKTGHVIPAAGHAARSLIFSAFSHLVSQNDKVIKGLPNLLPP